MKACSFIVGTTDAVFLWNKSPLKADIYTNIAIISLRWYQIVFYGLYKNWANSSCGLSSVRTQKGLAEIEEWIYQVVTMNIPGGHMAKAFGS